MSKRKSYNYQSLSPTPSTSPSISPGQSSGNNRPLTTAEVIKLLRQSGPSEVADYLERHLPTKPTTTQVRGLMSDYPDTNGNGIPDAFENRASISEVLNPPLDTFTVEIERVKRPPKKGEICMMSYGFDRAPFDYRDMDYYIVRRVVAGEIPDPDTHDS